MKLSNILTIATAIFVFGGCVSTSVEPMSNNAMTAKKLQQKSDMELLDAEEEYEEERANQNKELYFADTQGKIFYSGKSATKSNIEYHMDRLLSNLFRTSKNKLPKIGRKKKLNISLEMSKSSAKKDILLDIAQEFILKHKRYALSNTDKATMKVLKNVIKREKDSLYRQSNSLKLRNNSNIILYLSSIKSKNTIKIKAKIISKNGQILGQISKTINLNQKTNKQWVEVRVPRIDAPDQLFEVMRMAVTKKEYRGIGGDISIGNLSFISANNFCKKNMKAELLHPYVFESARVSLAMKRPSSGITSELMAPYDEEDHEVYFQEGDSLEGSDSSIVIFNWNNEKYFAVSNLYKSPSSTFRCMRAK